MKKTLFTLAVILIAISCAFLSGCVKEKIHDNSSTFAQNWYRTKASTPLASCLQLDWSTAVRKNTASGENVLEVRISNLGALSKGKYNIYPSVLFLLNKQNEVLDAQLLFRIIKAPIQLASPGIFSFKKPYNGNSDGFIRTESLTTAQSTAYSINNGIVSTLSSVKGNFTRKPVRNNNLTQSISSGDCGTIQCDEPPCVDRIEWYYIVYDEATGEIISTTYIGYTCLNDGGGGGGGGGSDEGPVVDDSYLYTCPDNFTFVSVTSNNLWQEAALSNINAYMVYFDVSTGLTTSRDVHIDQLFFGLPYFNIDGDLIYTKNEAKTKAAAAFNAAEFEMRQEFRNNPTLSAESLKTFWIQRADYHMKQQTEYRGKAAKQGSINPSTIVPVRPYSPC